MNRNDRLLEASAALLEAAGGALPITSLNKALFYLDLAALRDLGGTVTHAKYRALPAGPTVEGYQVTVVDALEKAGLAQQDEPQDDGSKPVVLLRTPERRLLNTDELKLVDQVARWAQEKRPAWLSSYSHENIGWKVAKRDGLDAGRPAALIDMLVAMQQVIDADPWVASQVTKEEGGLCEAADTTAGTEW